jgi:hypothetical protein
MLEHVRLKKSFLFAGAMIVAGSIVAGSWGSNASAQSANVVVEKLQFVNHFAAGMIEQDVFVERTDNGESVFRLTKNEKEKYLSSPLFASAASAHHAPFKTDALGPFAKGKRLGLSLDKWLAASGKASYSCTSETGRIEATFKNLVPNGVYTMWNFYVGKQHMGCPDCPFSTVDFPVGKADGSQSVFTATSTGKAEFDVAFKSCLPLSNNRIATALAIAYHSDGKTSGSNPGEFGNKTHVQLFTVLPDQSKVQAAQLK